MAPDAFYHYMIGGLGVPQNRKWPFSLDLGLFCLEFNFFSPDCGFFTPL
ncbi:hypothetical protein N288_03740 [Bacillus infantis NRRL B-14911]|uniref:Uncharacterized protein n=1 Tax=Bacillus infantis NRRL B-14911 TaxID=1367477 RepID=U5L4W7_9BACI|nr:hypothetical protein N288_03740 [Bacillus infantis NRRL B-14911]